MHTYLIHRHNAPETYVMGNSMIRAARDAFPTGTLEPGVGDHAITVMENGHRNAVTAACYACGSVAARQIGVKAPAGNYVPEYACRYHAEQAVAAFAR